MEEAVSCIKRSTAPHLEREAVAENIRNTFRTLTHITGTHTCRQQRLMSITHCCICDKKLLLVENPLLNSIGTIFIQNVLKTCERLIGGHWEAGLIILMTLCTGVVYLNLSDVLQNLCCTVTSAVLNIEEGGCVINKLCVTCTCTEYRVCQNICNEGDVCLNTANVFFVYRACCTAASTFKCIIPGCNLNKKGIVVR